MQENLIEAQHHLNGEITENANRQVKDYLLERRSAVYIKIVPQLTFKAQGWQNPAGDQFFKNQRKQADNRNDGQARYFFNMMKRIAREVHNATKLFSLSTPDNVQSSILDWCMAPGGFLSVAMYYNRGARYRAFSLPLENGGYKVRFVSAARVTINFLDLNLLAADMGVDIIPPTHPEAAHFLPAQLSSRDIFDLIICDGQVLRTHKRAQYRENLESPRLTLVQLALGLEHVRPGGKMIILLHRIESWRCVYFLYVLSKFSTPLISNPQHEHAIEAVRVWKQAWRTATFDTEEAYKQLTQPPQAIVEDVLESFGPQLIKLATNVWETQAAALSKAPFIEAPPI
ncbi:hypothetical protein CIB48_g5526 [Xylaria polymorpha]|nr:hypothetical protein CIB48_g5526 [Xylaria polymorpha]